MLFPCPACQNLTPLQSPNATSSFHHTPRTSIFTMLILDTFSLGFLIQDRTLANFRPFGQPSPKHQPDVHHHSKKDLMQQSPQSIHTNPTTPAPAVRSRRAEKVRGLVSRTPPSCALTTPVGAWVEPRDATPVHQSLEGRVLFVTAAIITSVDLAIKIEICNTYNAETESSRRKYISRSA